PLFAYSLPPRLPPSFPTRRSSDLASAVYNGITHKAVRLISTQESRQDAARRSCTACGTCRRTCTGLCRPTEHRGRVSTAFGKSRSEEHTSELQSRFDLVCRLLLEK